MGEEEEEEVIILHQSAEEGPNDCEWQLLSNNNKGL